MISFFWMNINYNSSMFTIRKIIKNNNKLSTTLLLVTLFVVCLIIIIITKIEK